MLQEEKKAVERMQAEGKISKEEAKSLFNALGIEEVKLENKKDSEIVPSPRVPVENKNQGNESKSILGTIIKNVFGSGSIFNNGEKYKVLRKISGSFSDNIIPEINIR